MPTIQAQRAGELQSSINQKTVIPAHAGIQVITLIGWIPAPAFAGASSARERHENWTLQFFWLNAETVQ